MNVNFEPASLLLSLFLMLYCVSVKRKQYSLKKDFRNNLANQHVVYIMLLFCLIISISSSVIGAELEKIASEKTLFWQYELHAVYYTFHNLLPMLFALYIMHVNGSSAGRRKIFYVTFFAPWLVCELIVLTNRLTRFAFYMDDNFVYHRGSLIYVLYAIGLIYVGLAFFFLFRYKNAISRSDRTFLGLMIGLSAAGVIIQGLFSSLVIELFIEAMTFVGILVMIESRGGLLDPLTGAYNRTALGADAKKIFETGQSVRFVFLKLTDISLFSKLFTGRDIENLLIDISSWLSSVFPEYRLYVYRQRVFCLLIPGDSDKTANAACSTILKRFTNSGWKVGDTTVPLEIITAPVRVPEDISVLDDFSSLVAYEYTKTGLGSRIIPFEELAKSQSLRKTENALRDAINNGLLRVWYQPIWSVEKGRTVAAEALLRIDSDELRKISPEVYIPVAESTGMIREIGLFVFKEVCRLLGSPSIKGLGVSYIDVNLSVYQFKYDHLASRFEEIRSEYGVPASAINLEITESASTAENPVVEKTMEELRHLGYAFSIDDYGSGHSNLKQLISSSYKCVKIDKSLLWDCSRNPTASKMYEILTGSIRNLGYDVVQEGVETKEQLDKAILSGSGLIQGYYFSKPLPESDFIEYLKKERSGDPL